MLIVPAGVKVHLALGYTDMRKGMDGLAMLVQETLKKDPFSGDLFAFRGKKAMVFACSPSGSTKAASARFHRRASANGDDANVRMILPSLSIETSVPAYD